MTAAAIHWLVPWLLGAQVHAYAATIDREATAHKIDPLLVVALIYHESRFHAGAVSMGGSHGLMQVHVSRTHQRRWLGHERALRKPNTNVRVGVRILARWRDYHQRHCEGASPAAGCRASGSRARASQSGGCSAVPRRRRVRLPRSLHPFWSHMQWGSRVRNAASGRRVGATYRALKARFGGNT